MTNKKFLNAVANSRVDILQIFLDILKKTGSRYCLIGGIAVNAYVEPVVSLDLDIVVAGKDLADIIRLIETYPGLRRRLPPEIKKLSM